MQPEEVKKLLEAALPDCQVDVESDGSHYNIRAIGDLFDGLRTLKRQQLIYGALSEQIADGTIHAVHMTTLTRAEADA